MVQVHIVRHDLGEAFGIGGLVGRRNGIAYLIVHPSTPLRDVIELARELLTPLEMTALRNQRASALDWSTPAAA